MSLTPIFDQLLSEQPLSFRECSDKIFPWPTKMDRLRDKINKAKRNHPSFRLTTAPRPINPALDSLIYGVSEAQINQALTEPLSGRIAPWDDDESWLKPFIAPPGTRFFMGYDPAGNEIHVAKLDGDGRIININPA